MTEPSTPARTPPVLDALASEYQGYYRTAHRDLDIADLVNNPQADRAALSTALAEAREEIARLQAEIQTRPTWKQVSDAEAARREALRQLDTKAAPSVRDREGR